MYLLGNNPRTSVATELDPHSMHCQKMMLSLVLYSIVISKYSLMENTLVDSKENLQNDN
jgi:hypothetical protein